MFTEVRSINYRAFEFSQKHSQFPYTWWIIDRRPGHLPTVPVRQRTKMSLKATIAAPTTTTTTGMTNVKAHPLCALRSTVNATKPLSAYHMPHRTTCAHRLVTKFVFKLPQRAKKKQKKQIKNQKIKSANNSWLVQFTLQLGLGHSKYYCCHLSHFTAIRRQRTHTCALVCFNAHGAQQQRLRSSGIAARKLGDRLVGQSAGQQRVGLSSAQPTCHPIFLPTHN